MAEETEVDEGEESCERERLRDTGTGGGDFRLDVRLRLRDLVSSSGGKF